MKYMIILLPVFYIVGCLGTYHHKVLNVGDKKLYGVEIQDENHSFGYGYLSPGIHKSSSGTFKISKGDKIIVSWGLGEKSRYQKEVFLDKSPVFKEVVFLMDGKDVTVDYEPTP